MPPRLCVKLLGLTALLLFAAGSAAQEEIPGPGSTYGVLYTAWIKAADPWVTVRIRITHHAEWVNWMRFNADPARYRKFKGSGDVLVEGSTVTWRPPLTDAWLQYSVNLQSKRESGRYDGQVTDTWAMFRADDLVPPVHLGTEAPSRSESKLRLNLPDGWSMESRYARYKSGRLRIESPERRFDRPTGWMLVGKLGSKRETIGGTRLAIVAPTGQGVRRMDMLAFFRWTLPTLQKIFPAFPQRLLVVSAGDPMWRGALSGPSSLYVHTDRPLISENGTSTFIHELVHVAMSARSAPNADWIVEGLAEYYSLEVLRRSGAISAARFETAHQELAAWAKQSGPLDAPRSSGATTARAVGVLRAVDAEIRSASRNKSSLDEVVRELAAEAEAVTLDRFREIATRVAGAPLRSLPT